MVVNFVFEIISIRVNLFGSLRTIKLLYYMNVVKPWFLLFSVLIYSSVVFKTIYRYINIRGYWM